ncbi:SDR family oxidoreductase [Alkalihalobacillus sp. LMS39]|uniref:SDR family oxidoreductase n=1 Tax=Alkalihalobacillus sp. LMS39 TaxID=2924032 RepID=UPI001FB3EB7E|nr:SDR family oxidoreductase [Alkalihalobacillus sp. LMS39]UOE93027.1 SDR family oxidoreductase [Alkalihalobacillus sp. LMS39]
MERQVVFITGAGSGFGMEAAIQFALKGYDVIATVRSIERSELLRLAIKEMQLEQRVTIKELDVTNFNCIPQVIEEVIENSSRIDILINNAGFAMSGFCEDVTIEEWKEQFETNVFGLIAVTNAVLPYMRKQNKGKILMIGSISSSIAFPGIGPYVASKHAIKGYSESLRLELVDEGIHVCFIEPGSYKTNIWSRGKRMANKAKDTMSPNYNKVIALEHYMENKVETYGDKKEVGKLLVSIASSPHPSFRFPIGRGVKPLLFLNSILPWKIWEWQVMKQIRKILQK